MAVDFDALLGFPPPQKQVWIDRLARFPRLARRLQPMTLRWYPYNRDCERFFYWLMDRGFRIAVIVRREYAPALPYYGNLIDAVHAVLDDFPAERFHLITETEPHRQGSQVTAFCRTHSVQRYFTGDPEHAATLPNALPYVLKGWDSIEEF